ncbi:PREDICTED: large proline-rich protein BAG6 isoform X1 [Polistes canadensis]|uniref:large proline-rich protein BAG6 isoform X1 n=1 Tax=Polistes canadensis TaxID=91411 RepID=UPI000718DBDD|nr:PREDICTED: large proline-rich protein BAG6 isoform X1 [Polistes canadensis]XP_014602174.1 PREDICTED: large proline-rich protein BAG6 isoform X1 [Polistes canadensis]
MINLTVKTLDSQNHAFSLEDDQITVRRFKEHIAESVAVPADSQRLIYCGRVLQDDKKLNDYDVNGKVIHLVQSAPPQPGQRNNDSGQSQGQQNQGWQNQQRPHYRFSHAQMHGNAMYLGAMSVPAEIVEGHGLPVPQLSNSLSNSRLIVAKRMLNRANELMDRLDDPSAPLHPSTSENNQSPLPQQIQVQDIETDQEDIFRIAEGRQSTGTRLSEAVAAALGVAISASGASNVTLLRGSNDDANEGRTTSNEAQEDAEMESSAQSQSEQQGTSNASGQNSRRPPTQLPRPPQMGYLLDRLLSTQDRLRPYIERYRVLMLADPSLPPGPGTPEVVEETQRMVDGVSECLHYLSHSCHALSDIIVDMRQQPPRNLRCRPIIIQHSAILQAGVPIQVEAHISLHGRNANNNNGNEETTESTNAAQQPSDIVVASGSIEVTTEDNNQPQESSSTPPSQPSEQQRPQEPPQSQFVFDLSNNVEVLMEVSPDSNMEASSGNEPNQSGENNNNNNAGRSSGNTAGIFPWGSAPTPDFLRNLMQAVAGHMAQGGIATVPLTTRTTATTAGGTQQTVAATMDSTSTNAAQSTQARSNVGTHPTTATQTRSTSRPHVFHQHHAHPLGVGMSMGQGLEFDPFLPCNSHHVRRTPTSTPNVTVNSQSTRASQTPAQETQPQAQTASTSTASSTASSTSTASPTSSQNTTPNPIINFLRQIVGDTSGQQQTNINVNSSHSDPDLAENIGNLMEMVGNGNIHIGIVGDGGGTNLVGGNVTLANLLEINDAQSRENITEENLLAELALIFARYMTVEDVVRLRLGRSEPIARLRVPLRFLCCVIMNNSTGSEERDQVVERLILHYRPHLQQLLERAEDSTGRSGSTVDLCATIESILSRYCKEMLRLLFDPNIDDSRFGYEILIIVKTMGSLLCTVLRYSLRGGQAGLESVVGRFMFRMVNAVNPTFREWMLSSFILHFRTYSLRIPQPPDSEILPLLIYKDTAQTTSGSSTVSHESTCSTQEQSQQQQQQSQSQSQPQPQQPQQQQSQHEPMETETMEEKSNNEASVPDEGEDIPETFPGHESLPSEWIPIIARDGVRQRRQLQMQGMANSAVTTFSDAYIGSLPTKRRKLIEQQKPRLLVSPTPNHSAITASVERLVREGVSRAGIEEVEGAAVAVATDPGVRHAFGQAIRDCLNPRRYGTPDFPDPLRFPNATKYFSDQERSSK